MLPRAHQHSEEVGHARKTHLHLQPDRGRIGAARSRVGVGTRQADGGLGARAAAFSPDRAYGGQQGRSGFPARQGCGSESLPSEQSDLPVDAFADADFAREHRRRSLPEGHLTGVGAGALPRPAGRARLVFWPGRSRIHVPARSTRHGHADGRDGANHYPARCHTGNPARGDLGRGAGAGGGAERYTVHRGDTLRAIAQQFKPDQATLDQMLDALFRGNSSAFDGANMNRLRAGAIVTIPTAAQVQAVAPEEATRVVHVQAEDWRNYRDRIAAAAPGSGGGATREASGKIGVAVEDKTPTGAPGSDKLKVSREAATGNAAASENGIARGQELKDAETRIAQLEKTVAEMQQALDLKNQTLAQLQGQTGIAKGGPAP